MSKQPSATSSAQHKVDLDYAEEMGWEAGRYGPNKKNCHFAIFSAPEFTSAWEAGKKRGEHDKFMEENRSA